MKKLYELIGFDGCLYCTVTTTSFKKARQYFSEAYSGKFKIICNGVSYNVRL